MKQEPNLKPAEATFNIVNVMLLRDHLVEMRDAPLRPAVGFNMLVYYADTQEDSIWDAPIPDMCGHECRTVACIAGHATILSGVLPGERNFDYFSPAKRWLGLSWSDASYLFGGDFDEVDTLDEITLDSVISQLDHMIKTGRVMP